MATFADNVIEAAVPRAPERIGSGSAAARGAAPAAWAEAGHDGGSYGADRRLGWPAIAMIVAVHVVLFGALCYLDVVHVGRKQSHRLTVMEIKPLEVTPPPPAAPRPKVEKTPPVERPIMAPPPIVQVAAPAPPITAAPIAPPAPPAPPSAPAPSASISEVAAPITAPDGSARTLGNTPPRYPVEARRQHQEGTVRLRVVITPEGRVREISVARSSGFDTLDQAALEAVRKWKFLPGKQAGVPVEAVGFVPIPFRLT